MSDLDMSLARPTLDGISDTGAGGLKLSVQPLHGMITLRADLSDAIVANAVKAAVGSDMPDVRKATETALWMSPADILRRSQRDCCEADRGAIGCASPRCRCLRCADDV